MPKPQATEPMVLEALDLINIMKTIPITSERGARLSALKKYRGLFIPELTSIRRII